jgi:hypothetical protein
MDDVHKYFTWAPEEVEISWTINHDSQALNHYQDSISALDEWRKNYLKIK